MCLTMNLVICHGFLSGYFEKICGSDWASKKVGNEKL